MTASHRGRQRQRRSGAAVPCNPRIATERPQRAGQHEAGREAGRDAEHGIVAVSPLLDGSRHRVAGQQPDAVDGTVSGKYGIDPRKSPRGCVRVGRRNVGATPCRRALQPGRSMSGGFVTARRSAAVGGSMLPLSEPAAGTGAVSSATSASASPAVPYCTSAPSGRASCCRRAPVGLSPVARRTTSPTSQPKVVRW
jgi:hypothetical protein